MPTGSTSRSCCLPTRLFGEEMPMFEVAAVRRQLSKLGARRCDDSVSPYRSPSSYEPLRDPARHVTVVTTAAVPWMTGTAVNPLLRAGHLAEARDKGMTTLLVPWVDVGDQRMLFPRGVTFGTRSRHRAWILSWLASETGGNMSLAATKLRVRFYDARYHPQYGSIFSIGSFVDALPQKEADVCILEEPEHLNWYRFPETGWMDKFVYVVGIVHTNYVAYAKNDHKGLVAVPLIWGLSKWMCMAYCHRIIKLSSALQSYAPGKEVVCNIHGVRDAFIDMGRRLTLANAFQDTEGVYFIGKILWTKGLSLLMRYVRHYLRQFDANLSIDLFGTGPDLQAVSDAILSESLPMRIRGYTDHASLTSHRVFVNPSLSEVLCTTTAEAVAMGKWVVLPRHPSNIFFERYPTCLFYPPTSPKGFCTVLRKAINTPPPALPNSLRDSLSWSAAMKRLYEATSLEDHGPSSLSAARSRMDKRLESLYRQVGKGEHGDVIRRLTGGSVVSEQIGHERRRPRRAESETGSLPGCL